MLSSHATLWGTFFYSRQWLTGQKQPFASREVPQSLCSVVENDELCLLVRSVATPAAEVGVWPKWHLTDEVSTMGSAIS